ncbi:unnamed protein product [Didymodactylos carnosus]|uniref:Uncharacterized protein n=1 Tax=Didymodactylos carnosus TaxID=1234261 RepID=A0A813Z1W9_9BILA|nr:unnamed protein product [Didymodactylos carnosus]CAF0892965.1 unnamed protein product [Didymodactylos carnosus]CAF3541201.1 unnamed protein product [Didymodactylos carnosus]CAF3676874.1 unnamed protein product [Didymodactylos carnosus]
MLLIPLLWCRILMYTSLVVCLIQLIQLFIGLYNRIKNWKKFAFNLYLFHHLLVCICRSLLTFFYVYFACSNKCFQFELITHCLLLISSFDIILFVISESAHFWDSSVQIKSSLYNYSCLIFGLCFIYFISSFFLSIHLTIGGKNPFIIELCLVSEKNTEKLYETEILNQTSFIPTIISFVLFVLIDILTFSWIRIIYKEIYELKRKSLASVFFQSLVFTKYKAQERSHLVDLSLKRLQSAILFVSSNIVVIIPILIVKLFQLTLTTSIRLILIFLTSLPLCECLTFLFYEELKLTNVCFHTLLKRCEKEEVYILKSTSKTDCRYREEIGTKLSSYREIKL